VLHQGASWWLRGVIPFSHLRGGNVCAVAQKRGIIGFILDGAIRDIAEIRAIQFPVFARGITPIAAGKHALGELNTPVRCGGALIEPGDVCVGDEEGLVVIPRSALDFTLQAATSKIKRESTQSLEVWEADHRVRIDRILRDKGFLD